MAEIVRMPALSDTMEEGTLVAWHKSVGDSVESGELLAEIETDKAVMEFQSFYDGVLLHIGIEEGSSVPVDQVIAVIGDEGEDYEAELKAAKEDGDADSSSSSDEESDEEPDAEVMETVSEPLNQDDEASKDRDSDDSRLKASPLARSMAREEDIDLAKVEGSGDDGRIIKRDIEAYLESRGSESEDKSASKEKSTQRHQAPPAGDTVTTGEYEDVPVSQMRKVIARRLGDSKFSAPHFYLNMEINMDKTMEMRKRANELSEVKISFNDFVVKAAAKALQSHPEINASWLGDKIRYYKYINVGVAVAIDEGLLVPVIRNTDTKSLSQISTEVRDYAGRAKDRKLSTEEMQGNTFTISNLGMFGIENFTAIINPPDACILAVGSIAPKLIMNDEGEVVQTNVMKVTLSCDHRVVDGAKGAQFLQTFKAILEDPIRLMI